MMHKIFGTKQNLNYYDRPGAYILPVKDGKIAVVETPKGFFFLGGKIEEGEDHTQCIERECIEEIGFKAEVGQALASAEAYTTHEKLGPFHPIQYYYLGNLTDYVKDPIENDHKLRWISLKELQGKMYSDMQNWALALVSNL